MGSYHQRSERFLNRHSAEIHDTPDNNPLHDIFKPKLSKKKYFTIHISIHFVVVYLFEGPPTVVFVCLTFFLFHLWLFSRNLGSYHQRSERFLNRNLDSNTAISIIGRPSATPVYDIGVEIRPTKPSKKKYSDIHLVLCQSLG